MSDAILRLLNDKMREASDDGVLIETPWLPFKVQVAFLGKKEWTRIGKECTRLGFNYKTHRHEEIQDSDKFRRLYAERVIKNWSGLTADVLQKVLPVSGLGDLGAGLAYSQKAAEFLLERSNTFDNWLADVALKEEMYAEAKKKQEMDNLGESSAQP